MQERPCGQRRELLVHRPWRSETPAQLGEPPGQVLLSDSELRGDLLSQPAFSQAEQGQVARGGRVRKRTPEEFSVTGVDERVRGESNSTGDEATKQKPHDGAACADEAPAQNIGRSPDYADAISLRVFFELGPRAIEFNIDFF